MRKLPLVMLLAALGMVVYYYAGHATMVSAENEKLDEWPEYLTQNDPDSVDWKAKDKSFWKEVLSPERFAICRGADTERPFTGKYCQFKVKGTYFCACCGRKLFSSDNKFDSGTGWPSFYEASDPDAIEYRSDSTHDMQRTEVLCKRCGAHLGHVFDDGPPPSGKRYCINSICLLHKQE